MTDCTGSYMQKFYNWEQRNTVSKDKDDYQLGCQYYDATNPKVILALIWRLRLAEKVVEKSKAHANWCNKNGWDGILLERLNEALEAYDKKGSGDES